MATPIDPTATVDFDQPLNTDPDFSSFHIFSTDDVTGTFAGATQGEDGGIVDFSGVNGTIVTKEGITLYPIDSEFGFNVTDFDSAEAKTIDGLYTEGWVGDLIVNGEQAGIVVSDSPTDTFKTPALLGTWLAGLGGNTVKASTEHYTVMQNVLSDQAYPEDPAAVYALDDDLTLLSLNPDWNEVKVSTLLGDPGTYGVTDANLDGVLDIKDLLNPNESTIAYDIAYGDDYSVTMKDDGKLLYRWGNTIKRPNDVRLEATLDTPDDWDEVDSTTSLKKLYSISSAELVMHHTITNNPNDQVRPEDFENESAIGTLPTYEVIENYNGDIGRTVWASTDAYYAGDGTLYEAGTILRDTMLAEAVTGSVLDTIGATSQDLDLGYTNAWYTTMDREPFEPVLNEDGTEYITGPRWRLLPDKYGQDLPSVVIPLDPSQTPPIQQDDQKYEVGAETQTVLNLLDWATNISPLNISAGWQDNAGSVSVNGVNLSDDFDIAVYIKGDIKPATVYSAELLVDYDEITIHDAGTAVVGSAADDYLVGVGNNVFEGGAGSDLFVVSYGTSVSDIITSSTISDFEVGADKIGLIGFDQLIDFNPEVVAQAAVISQGVSGDDLTVFVDGQLVATLTGVAADLNVGPTIEAGEGLDLLDDFFVSNPGEGVPEPELTTIGSVQKITGLDHNERTVAFEGGATFENAVVFASPVTRNGPEAVTVEFSEITSTGATLYLEEPDGYDNIHRKEAVSLVVFEEGNFELADGSRLQVGTTKFETGLNNEFHTVTFDTAFDDIPVILLQVQTNNGADWEVLRAQNITTTSFEYAIQEAEASDEWHTRELVGWAAVDASSEDGIVDWSGIMGQAFNTGTTVNHTADEFEFQSDIGTDPIVAATIASFNGKDTANLRMTDLVNDGTSATASFMISEETTLGDEVMHVNEEVTGVAFETSGFLSGFDYVEDSMFMV
ncbi:hypothetical protein K3757_02140 [Sulfitobacter sp. S223]|uniref:hypothetical protein n=1 Tax=Sulfitobacter sp. S223 TaxID=2867023 RepID=UPI0021A34FD4|nr:hypothetical protein [Sulfitobacter sp. S223]UWR26753.1 hypothetical protein K3757_02140 [Sulfitobacter sp. S223]